MTGYKEDPLRATSDEERQRQEEADRLQLHNDRLSDVGVNTGMANQGLVPPARVTAEPVSPITIFQGRPAGFDPSGEFSRSWSLDPGFARNYAGSAGQIFTQQVAPRDWGRMVQQTWSEGATTAAGARAHSAGLEEGRMPPGPAGQSFAAGASMYDPAPPAQVAQQAAMSAGMGPSRLLDWASRQRPAGVPEETWQQTTARVGAGISRGTGLPFENVRLGTMMHQEAPGGGITPTGYALPGGESMISRGVMEGAQGVLSTAFTQGMTQFGGGADPKMALANVQRVMGEAAKGYVDKLEVEQRRLAGADPQADAQGRQMMQRIRTMVGKATFQAISDVEKSQGLQGAGELARSATKMSFDDLRRMAGGEMGPSSQQAAQGAVQAAGGWGPAAAGGVTFGVPGAGGGAGGQPPGYSAVWQVAGAGGGQYVPGGALGGGGAAGGGGGGRRGIWEGGLGGLLYGSYIARRFWSYTGAPTMRAMDQFAQVQAGMAPMLTGQIPQGGAGGLTAARGRATYALGQGAYNIFGGGAEAAAGAMQVPGVGTLAAGASVFGGAALGARIMGGALGGAQFAGTKLGALGGGLARMAGPLALAGLSATVLSAGTAAYEGLYGRQVTAGQMPGMALQTVARFGAGAGAAIGGAISGALGQGDAFAGRLGQLMDTGYGDFLNRQYGTEAPGRGLATPDEVQRAATDMGIAQEQLTPLLGGAYQITGERGVSGINRNVLETMNQMMQTEGMSAAGATAAGGGYAEALGYLPGTGGYANAFNQYGGMTVSQRARETQGAQTRAGLAGQFRQVIGREAVGDVRLRSMMRAFPTQQAGQIAFGGVSALAGAGMGQAQAMQVGVTQGIRVSTGDITQTQMRQGFGMMAQIAPYVSPAGLDQYGAGAVAGFSDLGAGQANIISGMMGGDLGAMSFGANVGMLDPGMALTDISGRATYQTNLGQGLQNLSQVAQQFGGGMAGGALDQLPAMGQLGIFQQAYQAAGGGGAGMQAGLSGIGISDTMSSFFGQNPQAGLMDYQRQHSNRMYGLQQAGIGIGQQRIQMQRQFMYGGGDWRNPSAGSLWGIQDRMRSVQWQGQQASMQFSLESMDVGNQFAMQQEDLTGRRMGAQQDYQRWGFGFQRAGMDLSRQFTMENRQFQDQMRGMQTAFQLEDFDEGIRMSSGRQRRQMVQQRERFVSMTNVQDEQTERQREQQEEMWAREDEQFEKRREYSETLMALDEEQYNTNIERRETLYEMNREDLERRIELAEELHELQNEQIEKQREYAVAQMDLAEKALGIQAASAAAQKEYNDDMLILYEDIIQPMEGAIQNISKYDTVQNILVALEATAKALDDMGSEKANALRDLAKAVDDVDTTGTRRLISDLQTLMATSGYNP